MTVTLNGREISAHIMTREDIVLPDIVFLSGADTVDARGAVLSVGDDRLAGYTALRRTSIDGSPCWLLETEHGDAELWLLDEELSLRFEPDLYRVTANGRTFPPSMLFLKTDGKEEKFLIREKGDTSIETISPEDVMLTRYARETVDLTGILLCSDGIPLPGPHALIREERNGDTAFYLDGKLSEEPLLIKEEDMTLINRDAEYVIKDGKVLTGISEIKSFSIIDELWLRITRNMEVSYIRASEIQVLEKSGFHDIDHEELVILDSTGKSLTDFMKRFAMAEKDGSIWFRVTDMNDTETLWPADLISVITDDDPVDIDPDGYIAFRDGKVLQNIDRIIKLESGYIPWVKLIFSNGLSSVFRKEDLGLIRVLGRNEIRAGNVRVTAEDRDIWDLRTVTEVKAEEGSWILLKASSGIITIWPEDSISIERNALTDPAVKEKLPTLSFVPEHSILTALVREDELREENDVPLIFPFSADTEEIDMISMVQYSRFAVLESNRSPESVLNAAANMLLRGHDVEIVTKDRNVENLLFSSGLYAMTVNTSTKLLPNEKDLSSWKADDREALYELARTYKADLAAICEKDNEITKLEEEITELEKNAPSTDVSSIKSSFIMSGSDLESLIYSIEQSGVTKSIVKAELRKEHGGKEFWKKDKEEILEILRAVYNQRLITEKTNRRTEIKVFLQQHRAEKRRDDLKAVSLAILRDALYEKREKAASLVIKPEDFFDRTGAIRKRYPIALSEKPGTLRKAFFSSVIISGDYTEEELCRALAEGERAVIVK